MIATLEAFALAGLFLVILAWGVVLDAAMTGPVVTYGVVGVS